MVLDVSVCVETRTVSDVTVVVEVTNCVEVVLCPFVWPYSTAVTEPKTTVRIARSASMKFLEFKSPAVMGLSGFSPKR